MRVPPVQLQQSASPELAGGPESGGTSDPGGRLELGQTPEQEGLEDFISGSPTPLILPLLGRGIPHQRRATRPAGSVGHGVLNVKRAQRPVKICRSPTLQLPHQKFFCHRRATRRLPTLISRRRRAIHRHRTTVVRCLLLCGLGSECSLESNFHGRRNGEVLGRTRARTRALNEAATGLVSMFVSMKRTN